jgi:hypothetical protein
MKKIALSSLIATSAALLSLASPATAGILNVTSGPNFTPDTAFTNNTIVVDTIVVGGLVHLIGSATVTPDATNMATIDVSGNYSADAGDLFSAAYSFTADLNIDTPATYTISGTADGVPGGLSATGTLMPGLHKYEGTFQAPVPFPIALPGTSPAPLRSILVQAVPRHWRVLPALWI